MVFFWNDVRKFQLQCEPWCLQIPAQVLQVGDLAGKYGRFNLSIEAVTFRVPCEGTLGPGFPYLLKLDLPNTFAHPFRGMGLARSQKHFRFWPGEHGLGFFAIALLQLAAFVIRCPPILR